MQQGGVRAKHGVYNVQCLVQFVNSVQCIGEQDLTVKVSCGVVQCTPEHCCGVIVISVCSVIVAAEAADPVISVSCEVPKATNHSSAQTCTVVYDSYNMTCTVPE